MAIQNFLSGGFYGKVGDVVGQRWHNKRTIRSYVIPVNPRTPAQQANRAIFKTAMRLAQDAYNVNKGDPIWDTTETNQFSQMVSIAKKRLQNGMSESEAIPLYPEGYQPGTVVNSAVVSWDDWPDAITVSCPQYTFTEEREVILIYHIKDELTRSFTETEFPVTIPAGGSIQHEWPQEGIYSLPPGSTVQWATADDDTHGGRSIFMPPQNIPQPSKPTIYVTLDFNAPYNAGRPTDWYLPIIGWDPRVLTNPGVTISGENQAGTAVVTVQPGIVQPSPGQYAFLLQTNGVIDYSQGAEVLGGDTTPVEVDTCEISFDPYPYDFTIP